MSWIKSLQETYDNCKSEIGVEHVRWENKPPYYLFPICHTSQNAQIEIELDADGNFLRASTVSKITGQQTILPATEGSAGRSGSKLAPLSLGDKLQYIAGDYEIYYEEQYDKLYKGKDKGGKKQSGFDKYLSRLERWCASAYSVPEIQAVLNYAKKRQTISDLIKAKILRYDENEGIFPLKWEGEKNEKPEIYSVITGDQLDSLIRFSVNISGQSESHLWKYEKIWKSWSGYYLENKIFEDNFDIEKVSDRHNPDKKVFCHIDGTVQNYAGNHPAKIRNSADGAKLISSNDSSGFTYRGRFLNDEQACTIGYEVSQKSHNALRWLISKQGYIYDNSLAIVAWSPKGVDIPDPFSDSFNTFLGVQTDSDDVADTAELTGLSLSKRIAGYSEKLGPTDSVVVMGVNSATPGRMSVSFYRELSGADFLKRVDDWHSNCAWHQKYSKNKSFHGAPAPKDIAWAAYGTKLGTSEVKVDEKVRKSTVERLLPCIIDGIPIPVDIVKSLVRAASKRIIYENWEWEKILGIACAAYRYSKKERGYDMSLEKDRKTRDYLFGRLLAVADCLEGFALSQSGQNRPTNAARLMQRFADRPSSTWRTIELALAPYKDRLGFKGAKYEKALQEIMNSFNADDFIDDSSLSGEFLLAFHTQSYELKKSTTNETNKGE